LFVIILIITVAIVCLFILGLTIGRLLDPNSPPPNADEQMEEFFLRDKESFLILRDYLIDARYEHDTNTISISRSTSAGRFDGTMYLSRRHRRVPVEIEEEAALRAIHQLFRNRYGSIVISDNHVRFQRWSTRNEQGTLNSWGALYLLEGDEPFGAPPMATITLLAPLSIEGWYFYKIGALQINQYE